MLKWIVILILVALALALVWRQFGTGRGDSRGARHAGFEDS